MIITRTPLRVSFFGGGTDLVAYTEKHIGCTLSCTIDKYVYVAVNHKFDGKMRVRYSETENVEMADEVKHDRIRECLKQCEITSGVEVVTIADVPGKGTGLGSSSSLTVGLLNALYTRKNLTLTPESLAEEACEVEIARCKAPIGKQDQYAAALGGMRLTTYGPTGVATLRLPIPDGLQERLMLFYTGITRSADNVLSEQAEKIVTERISQLILRTLGHQATDAARWLLSHAWQSFGTELDIAWCDKQSLWPNASNAAIDRAYRKALDAGAIGGKICGAGGGGFMLLFAEPDRHVDIEAALPELQHMPFRLTEKGSEVIYRD